MFNTDRARVIESFRRQAELDAEIACFGHTDPLLSNASRLLRAAASHVSTAS